MSDPGGSLAIETRSLTKKFGNHLAVNNLNLAVPRGSVFGFLGPNGSGKTTTIRMLLGLASASTGEIRILGGAMPAAGPTVLPRVGALVEGPAFYPFLSGRDNLRRLDAADRHTASSTRSARVDAALERVGLGHAAKKPAHAYSLGMKQRLGIANALLTPRDLLILDEPSNGLDPQGTREVRNLIRSLASEGTTIFLSSHLLAEVEQICSHIAVMSAGNLLTQGTLDDLRAQGIARVTVRTPDAARARQVLTGLGLDPHQHEHEHAPDRHAPDQHAPDQHAPDQHAPDRHSARTGQGDVDEQVTADLTAPGLLAETVTAALVDAGVRVRGISVAGASLEERFVALTGEGFDVAQ